MMVRSTSYMSYKSLLDSGVLGSRLVLVLRALKKLGVASDREIVRYLKLEDPNIVRPRRRDLVRFGVVEEVGKRECLVSHKTVFVWRVKDRFRFRRVAYPK